jgi:RNA polymerase sigma-70 factor (ECF subfamily)
MASDIAQEAFLRIWEKQPSANHDRFAGLLFKIARDEFVNHYRKQTAMARFTLSARPDRTSLSAEDQMIFEETKSNYESALASLPEKQRTVFLMSRMDQMTYQEIAVRLGLSIKAIEKRMSLALASLKLQLKN